MDATASGPLIFNKCRISHSNKCHLYHGRERITTKLAAGKKDLSENSRTQLQKRSNVFQFKVGNAVLARSAVAVLGLGFVDAGYSGDWSRIGAISKETEELLKGAAFLVVPLCIFFIFLISDSPEKEA